MVCGADVAFSLVLLRNMERGGFAMGISFSLQGDFIKMDEVYAMQAEVERCHKALHEKTGRA